MYEKKVARFLKSTRLVMGSTIYTHIERVSEGERERESEGEREREREREGEGERE